MTSEKWFEFIKEHNVGLEGASCWCWVGSDINNMELIGFTGQTAEEALSKLKRKLGQSPPPRREGLVKASD